MECLSVDILRFYVNMTTKQSKKCKTCKYQKEMYLPKALLCTAKLYLKLWLSFTYNLQVCKLNLKIPDEIKNSLMSLVL